MKAKDLSSTRRWWQMLLLLLVCLLAGSSPTWAACSFGTNSSLFRSPSVNSPWISIDLMFYDSNGKDAFFTHAATEGNHPGPALYVDGEYVCSPDWELAWPGKGSGSSESLDNEREEDGWWGSTYNKTNNTTGQTYQVRFWNPGKITITSTFAFSSIWASCMSVAPIP